MSESGSSGMLVSSTFDDQTFNFQALAPETLNTDCSFNEFMPENDDCNYGNNEISQVLDGCVAVKAELDSSQESTRSTKREEISKIKCDKNEAYLWNPRLYYEKTICPLCPITLNNEPVENKFKELTTPHFRKHLEQVLYQFRESFLTLLRFIRSKKFYKSWFVDSVIGPAFKSPVIRFLASLLKIRLTIINCSTIVTSKLSLFKCTRKK